MILWSRGKGGRLVGVRGRRSDSLLAYLFHLCYLLKDVYTNHPCTEDSLEGSIRYGSFCSSGMISNYTVCCALII